MKTTVNNSGRCCLVALSALVILTFLSGNLLAQQAITGEISKNYTVLLKDGSTISGLLTAISDKEVVIRSETMGEIKLLKENIRSMTPVSAIDSKKGGIWFPNPNPSRYLLGSSAIPMEKGSGYYQNTWVFVNSFGYAVTNNISIAGGFEIISIFAGSEGPYAFYINPRASFKITENLYAGANFLYANTIRTIEDFSGLATLNGFATFGNRNNNLTCALGWGWSEGEFSPKPLITVSGMTRVSNRIGFVSENWIIPGIDDSDGYYALFSYGIRFLGEKTAIDLAFINNRDIAEQIIIGIPWLDFVIKF